MAIELWRSLLATNCSFCYRPRSQEGKSVAGVEASFFHPNFREEGRAKFASVTGNRTAGEREGKGRFLERPRQRRIERGR